MKLHLATLRTKSKKPAHLSHHSSAPSLKGPILAEIPQCVSYRSDFPTTLARQIVHSPHKKQSTQRLQVPKKVDFDPKQTPSCLKSPKSADKSSAPVLDPEFSEFISPRVDKTAQRRSITARSYTAARKVRKGGTLTGNFPAAHLNTFSDITTPTKSKPQSLTFRPQAPLFPPSSQTVRQFFYRSPPTGPNSIYYSNTHPHKPATASIQVITRRLL